MGDTKMLPLYWPNGVPFCSEHRCPSWQVMTRGLVGEEKNCALLGHEPSNYCEPAIAAMAAREKNNARIIAGWPGMLEDGHPLLAEIRKFQAGDEAAAKAAGLLEEALVFIACHAPMSVVNRCCSPELADAIEKTAEAMAAGYEAAAADKDRKGLH